MTGVFFQLFIPNVKGKNTGYFWQHCNIELIFMLHFRKAIKYLPTESIDICGISRIDLDGFFSLIFSVEMRFQFSSFFMWLLFYFLSIYNLFVIHNLSSLRRSVSEEVSSHKKCLLSTVFSSMFSLGELHLKLLHSCR